MLILDEPEIHLHPQWQIDYAESIVLLQKALELTVIITTHSTQFLEAIELFTKKYESKDISSYYLAEESEKGTIFKNVTGDLTEIYTKLVNPSILLDKLRFELESAEDE